MMDNNKGVIREKALFLTGLISALLAFKSSEDPSLVPINNYPSLVWLFSQFPSANQIIFDLSVGTLVSIVFYILLVHVPENEKRKRVKKHLEGRYRKFKLRVISNMVSRQAQISPAIPSEELLDKERFREYFKENVGNGQNRWHIVINNFNNDDLRELQLEFKILIDELKFTFHELKFTFLVIDLDDDEAFRALKQLQEVMHRMKEARYNDHDKLKPLFRFLWSTCSGFDFITGYDVPDHIEEIIKSI